MIYLLNEQNDVALLFHNSAAIFTLAWIASKLIAHGRRLRFFFCRKTRCRIEKITLSLKVRVIIFPIIIRKRIITQRIRCLKTRIRLHTIAILLIALRNLIPHKVTLYSLIIIPLLIFCFDICVELMTKISDGRLRPVYFWIAIH